jgi:hypothetical protein
MVFGLKPTRLTKPGQKNKMDANSTIIHRFYSFPIPFSVCPSVVPLVRGLYRLPIGRRNLLYEQNE